MQTVKDLVAQERNRLEAAFQALENSIESYAIKLRCDAAEQPEAAAPQANPESENAQVIGQIQEIVKLHEKRIVELKEEIGRLSVDLVRLREENRALKDQNKQVAEIIGDSITAIEKMVAA